MAVDVVAPAPSHRTDAAAAAATTSASSFPISSALVPASAIVVLSIALPAASSFSTMLLYHATLAASLACFARAVWPGGRVDRALARARADLEGDWGRLRARAATAPVFAGAQQCARLARAAVARARSRAAEAMWDEDAACAARFVLRVLALGARLAATVLFDAARDEARAWAPSALGHLRRVVDAIRIGSPYSSSSCDEGGFVLKDVVCLVGTAFYALFTLHLLFSSASARAASGGLQFCAVCFAATCGLTMVIADWIDPPDDDADDDETDGCPKAGGDGEATSSRDEEVEVRESWRFLWVLVLVTHCVDAFLVRVALGPRPATLAVLALCNLEVLNVGRQVQLMTPEDDDGDGGALVDRWRRGAMVVYAACSVKVFVVYVVLDCYMAALGFLWLFVMADLLLAEEANLSVFDASPGEGEEDDEDGEETAAGFEGTNITGGAEGEVDEEEASREEHYSKTSTLEDEEHSNTSTLEGVEESYARCDGSSEDEEESSKEHEIVDEEQRQEETDCVSDGGSTDDGWDLVDVDPEMPAKANRGASRKSRFLPWKHAA